MGHKSPPSGPIQRQIHPLHAFLSSLFKIHFKNILPYTGFILFPHQLTLNLDEVFPFCSREIAFQYANLASTTQKYCRETEKWCALYHCFLVLVEIYIPFASPVHFLTWPYSSLLGCYLQGFWFGLPQNISGRDVECGRAAGGYSYGRSNRYGDDEI